jgi:PHP family Zn ribbon phosphoesterase
MRPRLTSYLADLHIHTLLSPCAGPEMRPENIWRQAKKLGIKILGITDHNSTANLPAFLHSAPPGLWVIPGMEVQTKEEIHMICLFPELEQAMEWGRVVRQHLPPVKNRPDYFGPQQILSVAGEIVGEEPLLLLNSISLSLEETIQAVHRLGGVIYPAHIDRPSFSIISQLGFLPPNLELKLVEISGRADRKQWAAKLPGYNFIRASDAHFLSAVGSDSSILKLAALCWEELLYTFHHPHHRLLITN